MSLVKNHLLRLLRESTERQESVHEDIGKMLQRLGEYHRIDLEVGQEIDEIERALDESYPGWRNS